MVCMHCSIELYNKIQLCGSCLADDKMCCKVGNGSFCNQSCKFVVTFVVATVGVLRNIMVNLLFFHECNELMDDSCQFGNMRQ